MSARDREQAKRARASPSTVTVQARRSGTPPDRHRREFSRGSLSECSWGGTHFCMSMITIALLFAAVALLVAWATGGPQRALLGAAPWPYYFGGLLIAFYLLSITYLGPRLGIGTAVLLVLLGQIVAAAAIDHFGLLGAPRTPLTLMRAAGLAMMAGGVLLARRL